MSQTDIEAFVKQIEPWLAKLRRPAWLPITESRATVATESSFCGTPIITEEYEWPSCGFCKIRMQLFVQLDLSKLPDEPRESYGEGFLQLFYCANSECGAPDGWEPFNDASSHVRIVPDDDIDDAVAVNHNDEKEFPTQAIVGWNQIDDLPNIEEMEEHGLDFDYEIKAIRIPELSLEFVGEEYLNAFYERLGPRSGDKLGGWPYWVQGVEYPDCEDCDSTMNLLFQVESEDHVPFMFGDVGTGHITQCADCPEVVAFGWACC